MEETESGLPGPLSDVDPARAYLGVLAAVVAALAGGVALFPRLVYDRFVWKYFWGPVYADAHGADCAVLEPGGSVSLHAGRAACAGEPTGAIIGYNAVNEVGYAVTLLFALVGLVLLLRRYDVGEDPALFWGLLPFMFLGGALRVVEDASVAAGRAGADPALTYPYSALFISPVIYFTMFLFALSALVAALWVERAGYVDGYERALAAAGTGALAATLSYLGWLAATTDYVSFLPQFTVLTVVVATLVTAVVWWAVGRFRPDMKAGTGLIGAVVVWAHSVDGAANVLGLDWGAELGLPGDMVGKHPVNRFIVETTGDLLPASVTAVTGEAWPFLLVKVAVAVFVVAIFDEQVFEESPRYAILMLVAIVAVGLGPGTRDMLRATFGI